MDSGQYLRVQVTDRECEGFDKVVKGALQMLQEVRKVYQKANNKKIAKLADKSFKDMRAVADTHAALKDMNNPSPKTLAVYKEVGVVGG